MNANRVLKKKLTALVTGSSGFVGSHLTRRLIREGWEVHILHRETSKFPVAKEFDVCVKHLYDGYTQSIVNSLKQTKVDVVFHLASLFLADHKTTDVENLINSNILFGTQLLEAVIKTETKNIINTGTSWQHYDNNEYNPVCLYAATKQAFESILEYYIQVHGINAITLKLFDTYGKNDRRNKLFSLLYKAGINNEILNMTEGEQLIDIVHVEDIVEAYIIAAEILLDGNKFKNVTYALTSSETIKLRELVNLYIKLKKRNLNINWGARPYRLREVMKPWEKGIKLPNWYPKISLENGLNEIE